MAKKITYNKKNRNTISNPNQGINHNELLKIANVKLFNGDYEIENREKGKIIIKPKRK